VVLRTTQEDKSIGYITYFCAVGNFGKGSFAQIQMCKGEVPPWCRKILPRQRAQSKSGSDCLKFQNIQVRVMLV
jgi:hypothetical protein